MPDLISALHKLASESERIKGHARANDRPAGPFTSAYLYLPTTAGPSNLFSLVRDATEAEKRPFGKLLPSHSNGSANLNPRRGVPKGARGLTPLRRVQRARGTPRELEATLYAAEEVIEAMADSAHSMARARKEVAESIARHEGNVERLAEVERALDRAMRNPKGASASPKTERRKEEAREEKGEEKNMSVEEAIAAEEAALAALEASLAPIRREVAEKKAATRSPRSPRKSIANSPTSPLSTRSPLNARSPRSPLASRSPRSPKVEKSPLATSKSSLQNSTSRTPRRPQPAFSAHCHLLETPRADTISRFSPLHIVATPRTRLGSSKLGPGSTIVSRMRASITPAAPKSAYRSSFLASSSRLPPKIAEQSPAPLLVPDISTTPKAAPAPAKAKAKTPTPVKAKRKPPPEPAQPGIDAGLTAVIAATATIRRTLPPEVFRMTLPAGESCGDLPTAVISHLTSISLAPLPTPPSPSAASATDSLPTTISSVDTTPVTQEAILSAHLCLGMLRRLGAGEVEAEPNHVPEADMKAELAAVVASRGWEEKLAGSVIVKARGQKLLGTEWRKKRVYFRR